MRTALAALAAASMLFVASPSIAAPCKDPKTGKFMKCPEKTAASKRCKDAKGKFAKCGTPGARPV